MTKERALGLIREARGKMRPGFPTRKRRGGVQLRRRHHRRERISLALSESRFESLVLPALTVVQLIARVNSPSAELLNETIC